MEKFIDVTSGLIGEIRAKPLHEPSSGLENLKELKILLDIGAITKEEYEEKKKKILEQI
jgi:hypothetical protein